MTISNGQNIIINLKTRIETLHEVGFLTLFEKNYFLGYVRTLSYLRYKLKKIIKSFVSEFDDQFYIRLFRFDYDDKNDQNDDPFYPLLEEMKKLLADLNLLQEAYDSYFHIIKIQNTASLIYVYIVEHRKNFIKDIIELMCSNYTVKIKDIEAVVDLDNEAKMSIDELFKTAIKKHHRIFFKTLNNPVKSTNEFAEMYRYLQIVNSPVNETCSKLTEKVFENQDIPLGQFVQDCEALKYKILATRNETSSFMPESKDLNVQPAFYKNNFLVVQEERGYCKNMDSKGRSTNLPIFYLIFFMCIMILFRKLS
jgi:predicted RNA-binding protein with RPS1 domain